MAYESTYDVIMKDFRDNLRNLRMLYHLSDSYLKSFGLDSQDLDVYESGKKVPSMLAMAKMAEVYDTNVYELLMPHAFQACND